jgi:hypothetical protein
MTMKSSNASGQKESGRQVDVGELVKNLKLHDSELDDVFLGKDEVGKLPSVKWMEMAKVLTRKCFSPKLLKQMLQRGIQDKKSPSMRWRRTC